MDVWFSLPWRLSCWEYFVTPGQLLWWRVASKVFGHHVVLPVLGTERLQLQHWVNSRKHVVSYSGSFSTSSEILRDRLLLKWAKQRLRELCSDKKILLCLLQSRLEDSFIQRLAEAETANGFCALNESGGFKVAALAGEKSPYLQSGTFAEEGGTTGLAGSLRAETIKGVTFPPKSMFQTASDTEPHF